MQTRSYKITGVRPVLMHNAQLSDPLNAHARAIKEISSKRKKTDADLEEMSRREWLGSFYWDDKMGPFVPETNLERMLRDAAKLNKMGTAVNRGLIVTEPAKLEYNGPRDMTKLWEQREKFSLRASVGVNQSRVIRTRPIFPEWSLRFTVEFDETVLRVSDIDGFVESAGRFVGLLEWRPKYGRFTAEVVA